MGCFRYETTVFAGGMDIEMEIWVVVGSATYEESLQVVAGIIRGFSCDLSSLLPFFVLFFLLFVLEKISRT